MTPQSHFTIVAPVAEHRVAPLRALLATLNSGPGTCAPDNALLPLGRFTQLHMARLFVLDADAPEAIPVDPAQRVEWPRYLVFLGDCDGPADAFLAELVRAVGTGLAQIFAHCQDYDPAADLLAWLRAHSAPVAASYVNWRGRTVLQVRQEQALQQALTARLKRTGDAAPDAQTLRRELAEFADAELAAGRLTITPPAPTPPGWRLRNIAHAIGLPLLGLAALPLLLLVLPVLMYQLRKREQSDAEDTGRPPLQHIGRLQDDEDRDVTNPFSAVGTVKPGLFRRWTVTVLLAGLDYACRHIYPRGHLTRVQTIHFARWAFLDNKTRLIFASNYDGSLESYMDDFINKVGWGLNLVFSNGAGYPHTDWLVMKGARNEQPFKNYLRGHEVRTDVWYKAYPGLTAIDLQRNARIRAGLRGAMTDAAATAWLRLL